MQHRCEQIVRSKSQWLVNETKQTKPKQNETKRNGEEGREGGKRKKNNNNNNKKKRGMVGVYPAGSAPSGGAFRE